MPFICKRSFLHIVGALQCLSMAAWWGGKTSQWTLRPGSGLSSGPWRFPH